MGKRKLASTLRPLNKFSTISMMYLGQKTRISDSRKLIAGVQGLCEEQMPRISLLLVSSILSWQQLQQDLPLIERIEKRSALTLTLYNERVDFYITLTPSGRKLKGWLVKNLPSGVGLRYKISLSMPKQCLSLIQAIQYVSLTTLKVRPVALHTWHKT